MNTNVKLMTSVDPSVDFVFRVLWALRLLRYPSKLPIKIICSLTRGLPPSMCSRPQFRSLVETTITVQNPCHRATNEDISRCDTFSRGFTNSVQQTLIPWFGENGSKKCNLWFTDSQITGGHNIWQWQLTGLSDFLRVSKPTCPLVPKKEEEKS